MGLSEYIENMPKAELHVHLEGSIRPATLLTLAERNGIALPARDLDGLDAFYQFVNFERFLQVYFLVSSCLQTQADFSLIAYEFGADMARQNVRYAEITFTPHTNVTNTGLSFEAILDGLNDGRARAGEDFGVEFRWVFDVVRNHPETQYHVAGWACQAVDQGAVGFGLGGGERDHPPEWFADAFDQARNAGLHSVPHAGEVAGPDSVWGAIRSLGAERIGHGVRCVEDPELVSYLREQQIPLEVCPTSNVCLGVYDSVREHPIRWLWDQGLYITVNSDDPPMFNTDLVREYRRLAEDLGFTVSDLEQLSLNAVRASFMAKEDKARLETSFQADFYRLRDQYLVPGGTS